MNWATANGKCKLTYAEHLQYVFLVFKIIILIYAGIEYIKTLYPHFSLKFLVFLANLPINIQTC